MTQYFFAIGSNIEPHQNVIDILQRLLQLSPTLTLSRIVQTEAVGFKSERIFLNLVGKLDSSLAPNALKARFNAIETALGRDRNDPNSSKSDRPADVDILFGLEGGETAVSPHLIPPEPYVRPMLLELLDFLSFDSPFPVPPLEDGVFLIVNGQEIGRFPTVLSTKN